MITTLLAYFLGIYTAAWIISVILTFIWRKCFKKEITRKAIIVSTLMAAIINFLIHSAYTIDLLEVVLIIISIPCVLLVRLPKKDNE